MHILGGKVELQKLDITAAAIALIMVLSLAWLFQKTRIGRALRAVADDHQAAQSVGISLDQIWVIVWFTAGVVALATGIFWGARSGRVVCAASRGAQGAAGVDPRRIDLPFQARLSAASSSASAKKLGEFYWGPLLGGGIESWLAYFIALAFLLVRPQGYVRRREIIERI